MNHHEKNPSNRILVIDDNVAIHRDFSKILMNHHRQNDSLFDMESALFGSDNQATESATFELDYATQGREGLALVQDAQSDGRPYSLAFVDGRMPPGWDGIETISHLWQIYPDLQVVLCTAYADYSWQEIRRVLGETDNLLILKKPFDNVEVLQLSHTLTKKWELNREIKDKLRKILVQLQFSIAAMPFGYILWDEKLNVIEWNPSAENIFGFSREEIIGRQIIKKIFPGDIVHPTKKSFKKIFTEESEKHSQTEKNIRKDGTRIFCRWHHSPVQDEKKNMIGLLSMVEDISEQQRIEKRRTLLENAVENVKEMVVITDKEAVIQYVNPSFEHLTGYSRETVIGQKPSLLKSGKHDLEFYRSLWETITIGNSWQGKIINKKKDGTFYVEEETISPIINNKGEIENYVAVKRDISDQLKLEKQLAQSQKMESLGTLSGGIAHDFNNILMSIFGFADLARMDIANPEGLNICLQEITIAANRAKELVKQILTFSRMSNKDSDSKPLKLQSLLKETLTLLRSSMPSTIEIEKEIDPDCNYVIADPTQIHQVILNLCTNAYHSMKATGGKLKITLKPSELLSEEVSMINTLKPGSYLKLEITDTGIGISEEHLEKIFEPYFTTKSQEEGTGLGLSIVHGIVKNWGGGIRVSSTKGKGTTFTLYFPSVKEHSEPELEVKENLLLHGKEKILLVDDDKKIILLSKSFLERLGYIVTAFESSLEALKTYKQSPKDFDIVITDMTMPKMDGAKLSREIKKIGPDQPIILCTGYCDIINEKDAINMGIQKFLVKPFAQKTLAKAVRIILNGHNS